MLQQLSLDIISNIGVPDDGQVKNPLPIMATGRILRPHLTKTHQNKGIPKEALWKVLKVACANNNSNKYGCKIKTLYISGLTFMWHDQNSEALKYIKSSEKCRIYLFLLGQRM